MSTEPGTHVTAIMRLCGDLADRGDDQVDRITQDIISHATALDQHAIATEQQRDRMFAALKRAIPGHYRSVLWFHYTVRRAAVHRKFRAWVESDKNTVGELDYPHWFRVFELEDDDWTTVDDARDLEQE